MNAHLPHSVRFPGGYVVTIKTRAPSTLRRQAKGDCFGYWDCGTRSIFIDKTITERKQRYVLTHELIHAFADWQHVYLGEDQ
jgi:Zn-dependent peptidase ImmA (M78 family)